MLHLLISIQQMNRSWTASLLPEKAGRWEPLLCHYSPTGYTVHGVVSSKPRKSNRTERGRESKKKSQLLEPATPGWTRSTVPDRRRQSTQKGVRREQRHLAAVKTNSKLTHGCCLRVKNQIVELLIILGSLLSVVKYQEHGKQGIQSEGYKERE